MWRIIHTNLLSKPMFEDFYEMMMSELNQTGIKNKEKIDELLDCLECEGFTVEKGFAMTNSIGHDLEEITPKGFGYCFYHSQDIPLLNDGKCYLRFGPGCKETDDEGNETDDEILDGDDVGLMITEFIHAKDGFTFEWEGDESKAILVAIS